jgi:hypothetical protein
MKDPLGIPNDVGQRRKVRTRNRVDQRRTSPTPPQLHQIRPLAIPITRRPFRINRDRTLTGPEPLDDRR